MVHTRYIVTILSPSKENIKLPLIITSFRFLSHSVPSIFTNNVYTNLNLIGRGVIRNKYLNLPGQR